VSPTGGALQLSIIEVDTDGVKDVNFDVQDRPVRARDVPIKPTSMRYKADREIAEVQISVAFQAVTAGGLNLKSVVKRKGVVLVQEATPLLNPS